VHAWTHECSAPVLPLTGDTSDNPNPSVPPPPSQPSVVSSPTQPMRLAGMAAAGVSLLTSAASWGSRLPIHVFLLGTSTSDCGAGQRVVVPVPVLPQRRRQSPPMVPPIGRQQPHRHDGRSAAKGVRGGSYVDGSGAPLIGVESCGA
jgi:hypothetical protein